MCATSHEFYIRKSPLRAVEETGKDKSKAVSEVVIIDDLDVEFFAEDAFAPAEDDSGLAFYFDPFFVGDFDGTEGFILAGDVDEQEVVEGHPLIA